MAVSVPSFPLGMVRGAVGGFRPSRAGSAVPPSPCARKRLNEHVVTYLDLVWCRIEGVLFFCLRAGHSILHSLEGNEALNRLSSGRKLIVAVDPLDTITLNDATCT